jgi:uncharacterized protein YdhG (YjbR/CyaY superfamily)
MNTKPAEFKNIDEYIAGFPMDVQGILAKVRSTIHAAAPEAVETISYQMPTFNLHGHYLVYFAAYTKHIGFYGYPKGAEEFEKEVAVYESGKGTLKFPYDQPIPYDLITRMVKYRVQENLAKAKSEGK